MIKLKNNWKAFLLLIIGLLITLLASMSVHNHFAMEEMADYLDECHEIGKKIEERMKDHSQILRAASAYFESSDTITRHDWKIFAEQSNIDKELPGIQGIGFSLYIPGNQLQSHIQNIRGEGFPQYNVKPQGERPFYTSIIYLEPFNERNMRAFGYDMFSEPVRRKAMEISRDSDMATLSNKVILVQETGRDIQAGTLMYLPVYRDGWPVKTVEQRRAAIRGWVYSPYRMNDLMQGILGRWDLDKGRRIHLQIFDGQIAERSKLFDSQDNEKTSTTETTSRKVSFSIEVNSRKWIMNFEQLGAPIFQTVNPKLITFFSGLIISILLSLLFLSLLRTNTEAQKIAGNLTKELKESEQRYQGLVEWSPYAALVHRDMKIIYVNPAAVKLFGATSEQELLGTPVMRWHHPDYHQIVRDRIRRATEEGLAAPMIESKYFKLDGTVMDLEVQGIPIIYNGLPSILATFNNVSDRRIVERKLEQRVKELHALYFLSQLSENHDLSLTELYQKLTDFLPTGWQYPGIACSRIVINGAESRSANFIDSVWKQSAPISIKGKVVGMIEVAYTKEMPPEDEGPFLREERALINSLADQLGLIIINKLNEKELQEYISRLSVSLEVGNMAWWEIDSATGNVIFDHRKTEMLGYGPEKFRHYTDFTNLLHPDDHEKAMNAMRRHLEGKADKYDVEYRILTQSGAYKWYHDIGAVSEKNRYGKPQKVTGMVVDISDRKKAERNLQESEERFKNLADHSRVITWECDNDGLLTYVSDVCTKVLGYQPEEITGKKHFYDLHPEAGREAFKTAAFEIFARKESFRDLENGIETIDGEVVWVLTSGIPVLDGQGNLTGYRGTDTDITKIREGEQERARNWR